MENQRSILLFEQAIKTEATKTTYRYFLDRFKNYYQIKDYDSLLAIKQDKLQEMLEDYLFYLKKHYKTSSIETVFFAIELFFSMNDVVLNFKKIRKMFPQHEKESGKEAYSDDEIREMIRSAKTRKHRAIIHFLASSGVRIGAIPELKIKHIKNLDLGCKSIHVYPDSKDEYYTFLTPEASQFLEEYLEERRGLGEFITENSPLFLAQSRTLVIGKPKPITINAIRMVIHRAILDAKIQRKKESANRFNIQLVHGFRKRFNKKLKTNSEINPNLAEKMMGHSTTIQLDNSYLPISELELFEEFKKAIPDLTLDEAIKLKEQLKAKEELLKKQDEKDKQIEDLTKRLTDVEKILKSDLKENESSKI